MSHGRVCCALVNEELRALKAKSAWLCQFGASTLGCPLKTSWFSSVAATCPAGSTGRADLRVGLPEHLRLAFFPFPIIKKKKLTSVTTADCP